MYRLLGPLFLGSLFVIWIFLWTNWQTNEQTDLKSKSMAMILFQMDRETKYIHKIYYLPCCNSSKQKIQERINFGTIDPTWRRM